MTTFEKIKEIHSTLSDQLYKDEVCPYVFNILTSLFRSWKYTRSACEVVANNIMYEKEILQSILFHFKDDNPHNNSEISFEISNYIDKNHEEIIKSLDHCDATDTFQVSGSSIKNKRRHQEDTTCVINDLRTLLDMDSVQINQISFFGIFDGHFNSHASTYVSIQIPFAILTELEELRRNGNDINDPEVISMAFHSSISKIDELYCKRYANISSGCTILISLVSSKHVMTYFIGDSQAYIIVNDDILPMTPVPHNLSEESERTYATNRGCNVTLDDAQVYRINKSICLSRSFGDANLKPQLSVDGTFVFRTRNGDEKYLVLGCDGLWDGITTEYVMYSLCDRKITSKEFPQTALDLTKEAKIRSSDNITCLVIKM